MKKLLCMTMACLSLLFTSCETGNTDDPINQVEAKTVRYEASVSDPDNYDIRVRYTTAIDVSTSLPDLDNVAKDEIVERAFTFEQKAKHGSYLYISAMPVPKHDGVSKPTNVVVKMYIDGKLFKSDSNEHYAQVMYILGQD